MISPSPFTATSMIGFMAGAGIVVRNSIILVDFIELRLRHGRTLAQACVESGSCEVVRRLLAQVEQADTAMAPAADMVEMGVKVQVLKRGTMFPMRAAKL